MNKDRKEYFRLYRLNHKEEAKQYQTEYSLKNKEKISLRQKKWRLKNKERLKRQKHEYYLKNKEKVTVSNRKWVVGHREQVYEQQRQWREQRRLKKLSQKKRFLKNNEFLEYESRFGGLRGKVIQRDGEKCRDCGLTRKKHIKLYGVDITVHHLNHKGRDSEKPEHKMKELLTLCLRCHGKRDTLRRKQ